jgi:hypothetical protein
LYGVANPLAVPALAGTIGSADVVCSAGVETNVIAISVNPPISQGWYYPVVEGSLAVAIGATSPTGVIVAGRIGAGADFASQGMMSASLSPNFNLNYFFMIFGTTTFLAYPIGASILNISILSVGQAITIRNNGSQAYGYWQRAPDQ